MLHLVHKWIRGTPCPCPPSIESAAIAYLVSLSNHCHLCASLHEAALYSSGHAAAAGAIRHRQFESIASPSIRQSVLWALSGFGQPAEEWIASAYVAHFSNRVANAIGLSTTLRFTPRVLRPWRFYRTAGIGLLCPSGIAPAPAFVSSVVAQRVCAHIRAWHGEEPGPNRGWVENYLADLSRPDRAIARLALLTSLASHQVDSLVRDAFRDVLPRPSDCEAVIRWSAALAAQRVIQTLHPGVVIAAA